MRHDDSQIQVIGNFNSENRYYDTASNSVRSLLSSTGRGYYVLAVIKPNHEPSEHLLNELSALAPDFEKDGRKIMILFANDADASRFNPARFKLPSNVVFGIDRDGVIASELASELDIDISDAPALILADTFNRVVFRSSGYTIGLPSTLLNLLPRLSN